MAKRMSTKERDSRRRAAQDERNLRAMDKAISALQRGCNRAERVLRPAISAARTSPSRTRDQLMKYARKVDRRCHSTPRLSR